MEVKDEGGEEVSALLGQLDLTSKVEEPSRKREKSSA